MRLGDNAMSDIGDKFRWVAYNYDGGANFQVAASGEKYAYEDLPLDNIKAFELWDWRMNQRVLLVNFKKGEKLVWRRRNLIVPGDGVLETCHIVGKIGKNGSKGILGIFETDGRIEAIPEFLPNSEWFYPPAEQTEKEK